MADDEKKRKVGRLEPDKKFAGKKGFRSTKKKLKKFQKNRRMDAAEKFQEEVMDEHEEWIKAIVAVGSVTRDEFSSESDLDLIVFIDDTKEEMSKKKKKEIEKTCKKVADECGETKSGNHIIHPQPPWTITEYWDMMRRGAPLAHSITQDGVPLYDTGFFEPIKRLYKMGRLPATRHSAEKRMSKVPKRLRRAERMKLLIVAKDIYRAMTSSLQAVLVYMGEETPAPKQLASKARERLVKNDLVDEKFIEDYEEVYDIYKGVEHNDVDGMSGEDVDEYIEKGKEFAKEMQKTMKRLEINRKAKRIQKNYQAMVKTSVTALKALDKLPEDPKKLPKAFKEHLVEEELIDPKYENTFGKILEMKKKLKDKDIGDISEHEINVAKNYVQGFMREVRELLSEKGINPEEVKKKFQPKDDVNPEKIAEKKVQKETEKSDEDDESEKFECSECGKEFDSQRGLSIHEGKAH